MTAAATTVAMMTGGTSRCGQVDSPAPAVAPAGAVMIHRIDAAGAAPAADELAVEEPLEIRIRGRALCVTMRTPGHDEELAAGFLLTEGVIRAPGDLRAISHCVRSEERNVVNVFLAPQVPLDIQRLTRHVFASSSCGLCGKATIASIHANFPPIEPGSRTIHADTLLRLPGTMRQAQAAFSRTGGLHAAALFSAGGELMLLREDVGRHNAVDKVLGRALLDGLLPLDETILLVSGRASFEIVQKALAGRVPVVAAISAPSSLAVQFARAANQTLVGFLREGRMNVYAGRERIASPASGDGLQST